MLFRCYSWCGFRCIVKIIKKVCGMNKSFYLIVSVAFVLILSISLVLLAYMPVSSMWKNYVVLYVSKDVPEQIILGALKDFDIEGTITLSKQKLPVISQQTVLHTQINGDYVLNRNNYFFDSKSNVQLYYVPNKYVPDVKSACALLCKMFPDKTIGLDLSVAYPWFVPVLCSMAFVFLCVASRKKVHMIFCSLFPLLYSFCVPVYTGAASSVLLMYGLFLSGSVWKRKKMLKVLSKSFVVCFFCAIPIPIAFMSSLRSGLMFLMVYAGTAASLCMLHFFTNIKAGKRRFAPVPILTAAMIPVVTRKNMNFVLVPVLTVAVLCVLCIFSVPSVSGRLAEDLYIPAPARYTEQEGFTVDGYESAKVFGHGDASVLPGLVDYLCWVWNSIAFPYRSLNHQNENANALPGETIDFPSYTMDSNGVLVESLVPVYVFDDGFIKAVTDEIAFDSVQIEYLLKEQGGFINADYLPIGKSSFSESNRQSTVILTLLFAMFMPIVVMLVWRAKK